MIGSQALAAFPQSDGSPTVYTFAISSYTPSFSPNATLSFPVYSKDAEYANRMMTIYDTIGISGNRTRVNQVWQAGPLGSDGLPAQHPTTGDNVLSMGTLDLLSGEAVGVGGNSRLHRKNIHGVLNAVSWGILLPIGAIVARYLKVFKSADPAWFYLHRRQIPKYDFFRFGFGNSMDRRRAPNVLTWPAEAWERGLAWHSS